MDAGCTKSKIMTPESSCHIQSVVRFRKQKVFRLKLGKYILWLDFCKKKHFFDKVSEDCDCCYMLKSILENVTTLLGQ